MGRPINFSIDSKNETSNNIPQQLITTVIVKSVGKQEAGTFYLFSLPPPPSPWPNVDQTDLIANVESEGVGGGGI